MSRTSPETARLAARVEAHMNSLSDYDPSWGILIECAKALRTEYQVGYSAGVLDQIEAEKLTRGLAQCPDLPLEWPTFFERLRDSISTRLNDVLCEMKPDYDDSIVGFNEAWDIVRKAFDDYAPRVPRGEIVGWRFRDADSHGWILSDDKPSALWKFCEPLYAEPKPELSDSSTVCTSGDGE